MKASIKYLISLIIGILLGAKVDINLNFIVSIFGFAVSAFIVFIKTKKFEKVRVALPLLFMVLGVLIQYLNNDFKVKFNYENPDLVRNWVLYTEYGDVWSYKIYNKDEIEAKFPFILNGKKVNRIALKAIDRLGNESNYDYKIIK